MGVVALLYQHYGVNNGVAQLLQTLSKFFNYVKARGLKLGCQTLARKFLKLNFSVPFSSAT